MKKEVIFEVVRNPLEGARPDLLNPEHGAYYMAIVERDKTKQNGPILQAKCPFCGIASSYHYSKRLCFKDLTNDVSREGKCKYCNFIIFYKNNKTYE